MHDDRCKFGGWEVNGRKRKGHELFCRRIMGMSSRAASGVCV
jgi:hypothetical protein